MTGSSPHRKPSAHSLSGVSQEREYLYHYTSAEAAIQYILPQGQMRLSSLGRMNDMWESRPWMPNLHGDMSYGLIGREHREYIRGGFDRVIRTSSKVACFTQEKPEVNDLMDLFEGRGWAHLAMWWHYGRQNTGVCLAFDKQRLIDEFDRVQDSAVFQFHGDVNYRTRDYLIAHQGIKLRLIEEFGLDAMALRYATHYADRLFFEKHSDWANEAEYRMIRNDGSAEPWYLNVSGALAGVHIGENFPEGRLSELKTALHRYEGTLVRQCRFLDRRFHAVPLPSAGENRSLVSPVSWTNTPLTAQHPGGLAERMAALDSWLEGRPEGFG